MVVITELLRITYRYVMSSNTSEQATVVIQTNWYHYVGMLLKIASRSVSLDEKLAFSAAVLWQGCNDKYFLTLCCFAEARKQYFARLWKLCGD